MHPRECGQYCPSSKWSKLSWFISAFIELTLKKMCTGHHYCHLEVDLALLFQKEFLITAPGPFLSPNRKLSDSRLIQCGGKDCPLADLSKVRRWQLGEWRDVVTISKCGRKSSSFDFLICLKRSSLKGWPWLGWHRHQLLHKSRCLIFTFPFFILSIHAFTISKVQVIRLHFFFRILQSQYEKSVSFSALGILHSGEEKISIMAKGNITPYIFQVQQRSTASPLKEYLTP